MYPSRSFPNTTFGSGGTIPGTGRVNIISPVLPTESTVSGLVNQGRLLHPDQVSSISLSEPFRSREESYYARMEQLDQYEIENLIFDIPRQKDIAPTDTSKTSKIIEITDKSTSKRSDKDSAHTIFDYRMGTINNGSSCGTCNKMECHGHEGRILFPNGIKIPYSHFFDVLLNVARCICPHCAVLLLKKEQLRQMGIQKYIGSTTSLSRIDRINIIAKASKNVACSNVLSDGTGVCSRKVVYHTKNSEESGFFIYSETVEKSATKGTDKSVYTLKRTGQEMDDIFRRLSSSTLAYLGFLDVEDLCAMLAVGVIVPPVPVRPYIAKFDKFKNPGNDLLSKLVAENETLKLAIHGHEIQKVSQGGQSDRYISLSEWERQRNSIHGKSDAEANKFTLLIEKLRRNNLESRRKLQDTASNLEKQNRISNLRSQEMEIRNIISQNPNPSQLHQHQFQLSKILSDIVMIESTILTPQLIQSINQQIEANERQISDLVEKSKISMEDTNEKLKEIETHISAHNTLRSMNFSGEDISSLITNLYLAHKEYISEMLAKVRDKKEDLRRRGMGKHAYYVGRAIASPGVDIEIGEIEIPEYLAPLLGVVIYVNSYNIVEAQKLLDNSKITYVKSAGKDDEVNEMLVKSGKFRLREGDTVVRHLRDGDPVVAVRMPTLHRNNMLAFRARIIKGSMSIRVHMVWTTGYNLDFDGDEISLYVPQGDAIHEIMTSMYAPLNLISPRSALPIGGAVYNTISAWYMATRKTVYISKKTWDEAYMVLTGRRQLRTFYSRMYSRGITMRTGAMLFSMMLPEDFNYPVNNGVSVKGVRIESGILVEGTLTKAHLAPGKPNSLIQAIYFNYRDDLSIVESFVNDMFTLAYLFQQEAGQTITAEDCAFGEQIIPQIQESKEKRSIISNKSGSDIKPISYYIQLTKNQFPNMEIDEATRLAQTVLIEKRIQKLGVIYPETESLMLNAYDKIIQEVRGVTIEEAQAERKQYVIGKVAELEGKRKLEIAETKIRMLGPVPKDKIRLINYEKQVTSIISSELGNVGAETAKEVRKFLENNLLDMANDFGAGAKGTSANIAMMGGHIGAQQLPGQDRFLPCITGNTRCMTTQYPGKKSLDAGGYISNSLNSGMTPIETMQMAQGNRAGMAGTVTQTANSGLFNKLLCKSMEQLITRNGSVVSQDGKLYQYLYGTDGLSSTKLITVDDITTFVDVKALADSINYQFGWELRTPAKEGTFDLPQDVIDLIQLIDQTMNENPEMTRYNVERMILSANPSLSTTFTEYEKYREYSINYVFDRPSYTNPNQYRDLYPLGYNALRKPWFVDINELLSTEYRNIIAELQEYVKNHKDADRHTVEVLFSNEYPEQMSKIREIYRIKGLDYWPF